MDVKLQLYWLLEVDDSEAVMFLFFQPDVWLRQIRCAHTPSELLHTVCVYVYLYNLFTLLSSVFENGICLYIRIKPRSFFSSAQQRT